MSAKLNVPQSNFYSKSTAAKLKRDRKLVPLTHPSRKQIEEFVLAVLPTPLDFSFENHGSLCLLRPLTPFAVEWVNENIGQNNGFQPYWPTVVIEPRYCEAIFEGIAADGLSVG
jgi:hypothetical protein